MDKPTVKYRNATLIMVGSPAYIEAVNHPSNPDNNAWPARTSTVLKYDPETGDFETKNTLYTLSV